MSARSAVLLSLLIVLAFPTVLRAQTPACDKLEGVQKRMALEILKSSHPYDCCDDTIWNCLNKKPKCALAVRLANYVCTQASVNRDKKSLERALANRAKSMMRFGAKTVKVDIRNGQSIGKDDAPVHVTAYLCVRCPFCSKLAPMLYREITSGSLKNKVKFTIQLFPIKGHTMSTESGLAAVASRKMGKFWPYMLKAYSEYNDFSKEKIRQWASDVGLNLEKFDQIAGQDSTRDDLVDSKKEGLKNGVRATPTIVLNGRMYEGPMDMYSVMDVIREEYDHVTGREYE